MSLNLYPMVGALIGQSINSGYIIWSRWKQFERLSMCKPQTRLRSRSDGVSVVFVLSLQIHAIWLDFISTSSPRLLSSSSSSCALAGPYQFSQLSRTVPGRTPVSGLGSGNRLGWLAGASRGLCLFCFILQFYFIFFMISSATI